MTPDPKPTEALKPCPFEDLFVGDDDHAFRCTKALLEMDEAGTLSPHGIGGHARILLNALASRLWNRPDRDAELAAMREALKHAFWVAEHMAETDSCPETAREWQARAGKFANALASTAGAELLERLKRAEEERVKAESLVAEWKGNFSFISNSLEARNKDALALEEQLAAVTGERDNYKRHNQWQAEELKAHKDGGKNLAERCYDYVDAGDELFSKAQEIMGGRPVDECLQDGFKWLVGTTWTDSYDGSVEVILTEHAQPMTQEQANAFLALGFGQVYESQGERGVQWTSRGPGKCCPKATNEDEHRICQLKAHLAAAQSEIAGLRKAILDAPHDIACGQRHEESCDCWKASALKGAE